MRQVLFKILFLIAIISISGKDKNDGRCSGNAYCTACTSCSSCKNCSVYGGTCGVCTPRSKPKKQLYTPPSNINRSNNGYNSKSAAPKAYTAPSKPNSSKSSGIKPSRLQGACNDFKQRYELYPESIKDVKSYSFALAGNFSYSDTSCPITKGEYFSCDGKTGYLVISYGSLTVIQKDITLDTWLALRSAKAKCDYYAKNVLKKSESYIYNGLID